MIMDIKDFAELIKRKRDRLDSMMRRKLPVVVGRMAKDHFQDNFRQGGFVDGGLHPWPKAKRALLGRYRCRQQLTERCSPAGSISSNRSDIHACRLPGKGVQRGGLCARPQLGRRNRCHRHRPHEALCMGQVLQGFGKRKKSRHKAKETRQTAFQTEGTESTGTVLEEHGATKRKNCTSASRSASSWAKAKN